MRLHGPARSAPGAWRKRRRMPHRVREAFVNELCWARSADTAAARWTALERAHILSPPWPQPHTRAHAAMPAQAVRERDRREAVGQVIRLLIAGPARPLVATPKATPAASASDSPYRCRYPTTWHSLSAKAEAV